MVRISSLCLTNYRCFGVTPVALNLSNLTALVGANGSGKSAALYALVRLFGTSQSERTLTRSDFHLAPGTDWEEVESATLRIEALLDFPELEESDSKFGDGIAACFKHMTIKTEKTPPYCRIRLDGKWERSNLPDGDVEQKLVWVTSPVGTPEKDEKTQAVQQHDRNRIHVHYVPAARDPARQIRQVSGSLLHTLLRAVEWSDDAKKAISAASDSIQKSFAGEQGVKEIQAAINASWANLHGAPEHRDVSIRPVGRRVEQIIQQVEATFRPGPADKEDGIERLSDGQRSLFYLAIVSALFSVQERIGDSESKALSREKLSPPILNVLAVEEPENHVAPHFLGRIVKVLREVSGSNRGQIVLSSHSTSILSRVNPEEVRHLRTVFPSRTTVVSSIKLPKGPEEHKFVREAVRAFPELYFSRFVVLGEGDSEEIVLPRLAEVMGVPTDASFVSVVPLGGRHVNHFWRLLEQIGIPYVTLLDLDRERDNGGWGRIKYALEQLIENGVDHDELLTITGDEGKDEVLGDDKLEDMHKWSNNTAEMKFWKTRLRGYGVFFSAPLDIDFMMLRAFPDAYQVIPDDGDGPDIPDDDDTDFKEQLEAVCRAVLKGKKSKGSTYSDEAKLAFFWYRYLFLGRSKPVTHISALARIADKDLVANAPPVLKALLEKMKTVIAENLSE